MRKLEQKKGVRVYVTIYRFSLLYLTKDIRAVGWGRSKLECKKDRMQREAGERGNSGLAAITIKEREQNIWTI